MAKRKPRKRTKHTGTIIPPNGKSKTWAIRWTEDGKRHFESGMVQEDDAKKRLAAITGRIAAGLPGMPEETKVSAESIGTLFLTFLDSRDGSANHKAHGDDVNRWLRYLAPAISSLKVHQVDNALLQSLVTNLKNGTYAVPPTNPLGEKSRPPKPVSASTIMLVVNLLSAFFKWAVAFGHAKTNPVTGFKALDILESSKYDSNKTPFIHDQAVIGQVFKHLPPPINIAFAISALSGLRPGEVIALRWEDVHLDRGQIHVCRSAVDGVVSTPKNDKARDVDMMPSLVAILRTHKEKSTSDLVCPPIGSKGNFLGNETIQEALDGAFRVLNLPRLTFYQAGRHTFASQWVMRGADIYRLSKLMGHASVDTTTKHYAHLKPAPKALMEQVNIEIAV